jgi:hypothetical protein
MSDWYLDSGLTLDLDHDAETSLFWDFDIDPMNVSGAFSDNEVLITWEMELDIIHSVALDFSTLIPEKFFSYQASNWNVSAELLRDYLDESAIQVGNWMTKVRDIVKLLSPNTTTSVEYLRLLGSIIGVNFPPEDTTSSAEMKKTLEYAVEWYKLKGTYYSIQITALINQLSLQIYDMYTNDYSTFYMTEWWTGGEDENPPGFDQTYYKSPHFGAEILLNKVYSKDSINYLWLENKLDNLELNVEELRPVHTVPHYLIKLNAVTDVFGHVIETAGQINTKVLTNWSVVSKYLDDGFEFDGTTYFDQSAEAFIKSITKWVLGTGNYPCDIDETGFVLEDPVLEGTIDTENITITSDKITFEFLVPKSIEQKNISVLGLYIPEISANGELVLASCFPKIDKDSRVELRVVVEVYTKDLS